MARPPRPDRRTAIADAAIAILASSGSRGLTHRAVDRHLGIAEGSTSFYYRTRRALLDATVARIEELELEETSSLELTASSLPEAARLIAAMVEHSLGVGGREAHLARFELALDGTRHEATREKTAAMRDLFVGQAERLLRDAGCDDPEAGAPVLALLINAVVLDRVAHDQDDRSLISGEALAAHIERILAAY